MATENTKDEKGIQIDIKGDLPDIPDFTECRIHHKSRSCGGVYGLGLVGALVYYISTSTSFWGGVLGILKALVWPAFLVHGLMKLAGL